MYLKIISKINTIQKYILNTYVHGKIVIYKIHLLQCIFLNSLDIYYIIDQAIVLHVQYAYSYSFENSFARVTVIKSA